MAAPRSASTAQAATVASTTAAGPRAMIASEACEAPVDEAARGGEGHEPDGAAALQVGAKQLALPAVRVRGAQNATCGTARSAATSISKNSRALKDIGPAISSVGNTWMRVL